jgi:hypothetical protein
MMQHHLSDPYHIVEIQWSGGIWFGFMSAYGISFGSDLLTKWQTFSHLLPENWNGLDPIGQQEPAAWCNITYQFHIMDIQWSGGNWFGFVTVNGISFGSDLLTLTKCQTFNFQPSAARKLEWFDGSAGQDPAA